MAALQPTARKTRFVCVSDTHNAVPGGAFRLPKGDVLLHAGDMTNQGTYSELRKAVKWLEKADFEAKIVTAGNHDITLDSDFYALHGHNFHNQHPEDPAKCQQLLEDSSILWLRHGSAVINLQSPTGPRTTFKIFGSPYSLAWGTWAFGYGEDEATNIWGEIPQDADIVMTHTPPLRHCDKGMEHQQGGCPALRDALQKIQPQLAVCGHIHEGRGAEFVRWSATEPDEIYKEERTVKWEDPAKNSKEISLVDLTIRQDDGASNKRLTCHGDEIGADSVGPAGTPESLVRQYTDAKYSSISSPVTSPATRTRGLASYNSRQCPETCIVNAAIMASSYHARARGKRFNKPIVVDIDLPMWEN